jgi:hypothetical protein
MATRRSSDAPRPGEPAPAAASAPRAGRARKPIATAVGAAVTPEARHAMIAEKAYLRAERRGFMPGREADDWLVAEAEVDALLKLSHGGSSQ